MSRVKMLGLLVAIRDPIMITAWQRYLSQHQASPVLKYDVVDAPFSNPHQVDILQTKPSIFVPGYFTKDSSYIMGM